MGKESKEYKAYLQVDVDQEQFNEFREKCIEKFGESLELPPDQSGGVIMFYVKDKSILGRGDELLTESLEECQKGTFVVIESIYER